MKKKFLKGFGVFATAAGLLFATPAVSFADPPVWINVNLLELMLYMDTAGNYMGMPGFNSDSLCACRNKLFDAFEKISLFEQLTLKTRKKLNRISNLISRNRNEKNKAKEHFSECLDSLNEIWEACEDEHRSIIMEVVGYGEDDEGNLLINTYTLGKVLDRSKSSLRNNFRRLGLKCFRADVKVIEKTLGRKELKIRQWTTWKKVDSTDLTRSPEQTSVVRDTAAPEAPETDAT